MPESLKTTTIRIHIISSIMPIPARRRIPFTVSASILLSFLEMFKISNLIHFVENVGISNLSKEDLMELLGI